MLEAMADGFNDTSRVDISSLGELWSVFSFSFLFCHLPTVGPVCSPFMPASLMALSHFFFFFN